MNINGNPSIENGDIYLSLRERDAPIKVKSLSTLYTLQVYVISSFKIIFQIAPGTKDLILITPLDKEGHRGPASVYVNVICDRRKTNDPVRFYLLICFINISIFLFYNTRVLRWTLGRGVGRWVGNRLTQDSAFLQKRISIVDRYFFG